VSRVSRVYLPSAAFLDDVVILDEPRAHYLHRVLRLRPGDTWAALDGQGRSWLCEVVDQSTSRRLADWPSVPPLPVAIEVGLALCKGSRFEDALEKLAELGTVRVLPLLTERTERGFPSSAKLERWSEIARAASALANRRVPMQVASPLKLQQLLDSLEPSHTLYCHPSGEPPGIAFTVSRAPLTLLVGPEGGFSPSEIESLDSLARPVSLGPLTLRVETAAVCAVSLALAIVGRTAPGQRRSSQAEQLTSLCQHPSL
jgi:16S rRNA (uracil1498-N3)-methyltransferase